MNRQPVIFGEVLFDCFPGGEQVLGGAPFNVAWHLQAFGHDPQFISAVGEDQQGKEIVRAMRGWGMNTDNVQLDKLHPTGNVQVSVIDNEPGYSISPGCAYDFIQHNKITGLATKGILYHGTLALRNPESRSTLEKLLDTTGFHVFMDANLRNPWWNKDDVLQLASKATWLKLNIDELVILAGNVNDIEECMMAFRQALDLELLVVTRGEHGAIVVNRDNKFFSIKPGPADIFVDTVGAGDAFTSVFLHGLLEEKEIDQVLTEAQAFASKIVGVRGALSQDRTFYTDINRLFLHR